MKKNIFLFNLLFILCAQNLICSEQNLLKSGAGQDKFKVISEVVQVYYLSTKKNWVKETEVIYLNGNSYKEWGYFPTKEEAERGQLNTAQQKKALFAYNEETDLDEFLAFPLENDEPKAVLVRNRPSSQPAQPAVIQKIELNDEQIESVAADIYNKLIFQFTESMHPCEIKIFLIQKRYLSYSDTTLNKISENIAYRLNNLDELADAMYVALLKQPDFEFILQNARQVNETYLKDYLLNQNNQRYISNDLKDALMNRFEYQKLNQNDFLKYEKDLYQALMQQDFEIPWSNNIQKVKENIVLFFQRSDVPNIIKIRQKFPNNILQQNLQARYDLNQIIDWVIKKITLPVNRPSEDLGFKLEQKIFQQQLEEAQLEKNRLENAMLEREKLLKSSR